MILPIVGLNIFDWRTYGGKMLGRYISTRLYRHHYGFWKCENGVGIKVELGRCYNRETIEMYVDSQEQLGRDHIFI